MSVKQVNSDQITHRNLKTYVAIAERSLMPENLMILVKTSLKRAVGLVQEKVLSQLIDERPAVSIKEANERLAEKVGVFNDRPREIDPNLTGRT